MPDTDRGAARRLIQLTVGEFVDAVAATEPPLPAGGSVAALSGAQSAALLALVCGVLSKRQGATSFASELERLGRHQRELLDLVDEDADAYEAFLEARRARQGRAEAIERMTRTPLAIGWACTEVIELSDVVAERDVRAMRGDVRAARHLAEAALRTALDLAEANIELQKEPAAREALVQEIGRLRERLA